MSIQLVAVQMKLDINDYWTRSRFEARMQTLMAHVRSRIDPTLPTLVVFPEDIGLMLVVLGMQNQLQNMTTLSGAIRRAVRSRLIPLTRMRWQSHKPWVPALFLHQSQRIAAVYFDVFSRLAMEHQVYIVAGSVILPPYEMDGSRVLWEKGPAHQRLYNTSYFFGPDGNVIGKQDKVFLIDLEKEGALHLDSASPKSLQVFTSPLGNIGIAICLDAFQTEIIDQLARQGGQILVQPSANPMPWTPQQQLDWLQSSYNATFVQGRFAYAVNPMLTGPLWDIRFFGRSGIISKADGFIRKATTEDGEDIITATVPHPNKIE